MSCFLSQGGEVRLGRVSLALHWEIERRHTHTQFDGRREEHYQTFFFSNDHYNSDEGLFTTGHLVTIERASIRSEPTSPLISTADYSTSNCVCLNLITIITQTYSFCVPKTATMSTLSNSLGWRDKYRLLALDQNESGFNSLFSHFEYPRATWARNRDNNQS